jgi:hypothetical protein
MATKKLTAQIVKDFAKYMTNKFGATIIDKNDAAGMKMIAMFLDMMGILHANDFMDDFSTTIGRRIYLPFVPGAATPSLHAQVELIVHELQHVEQYNSSPFKFIRQYLLSDAKRAQYEAEAYSTNMEMYWWYCGKLLNYKTLAGLLYNYSCDADDVIVVVKHLRICGEVVKRGGVYNEVSKVAIKWLNRRLARRTLVIK